MSATDTSAALESLEEHTRAIAGAITTLGRLLPTGMSITVIHPPGSPAFVAVTYPDGSTCTKEYQAGPLH
ncbi:MAG: hypothetical protein Q7U97_17615 [Rhodocyclaceae bacterium]|nr:hypothetical protein [Rhodocyclaceae bacterium]